MAGGHTTQRLNKSCILLTAIAGIERFAFKGVASNLVTYLTDVMKLTNSSAAKIVNSWCGLTSIMPLLVAPVADAYYQKYSTITTSSFLYLVICPKPLLVDNPEWDRCYNQGACSSWSNNFLYTITGLISLTSTAVVRSRHEGNKRIPSSFLFWSLCLISLGQGGYNPSLQAFGADQLDGDEELPYSKEDSRPNKKTVFFQGWYFGICSGSLLGVIVMSYIQDTFGWVLGFAIPAVSMALSMLVFSCGSSIYVYKDSESKTKTPLNSIVQSIKAYAMKCFYPKITLPKEESEVKEMELQEKPLCHENMENLKELNENSKSNTVMVANSKAVLRLLPIWTMLLMFAVIFQQPPTFFTKQGMTMKRSIGEIKIPPATLQSAITLSIILLMPLYDRIFIPIAQLITHQEKGISVTQRMGIGMALSVVAMVIAAMVEVKRLEIGREMREAGSKSETVDLSIFWLIPQYVLLGVSDIFTVVGMQEFFYSEVPKNLKTLGIALYTSVFGVGSFVSALLISVVEVVTSSKGKPSWFSDDMNEARLDNYYWLLATLCALSLFSYALSCKYYLKKGDCSNEF